MQSTNVHLLKVKPSFSVKKSYTNYHGDCMASSFHEIIPRFSVKVYGKKNLQGGSSLRVIIKAQNYRDEGRSSNMVDANIRILKERIEEVRNKERLERCCRSEQGWNYAPVVYSPNHKREAMLAQCFHLLGLVFGTAGLTIFSGTFFLCLLSLLIHFKH